MGDVTLRSEVRDEGELIVAFAADGTPVAAWEAASGRHWWYVEDRHEEWRAAILEATRATTPVPAVAGQPAPAGPDASTDLAVRAPGHEVLAVIERTHGAAARPSSDGMPGVLDDSIVPWCVGFVGEERVATVLAGLPQPWRVLHSIPVGDRGSDIDHLVIGPGGVFVINTKHHAGIRIDVKRDAVFLGSTFKPYLRISRHEAARVQRVLDDLPIPATARAVVCTVGAHLRIKESPEGVRVLDLGQLAEWLLSQPVVLTPTQVHDLFQVLRGARLWTRSPLTAAAAQWVPDLARHLAAEHAAARIQPRRLAVAASAPGPGRRRPPHRTRPPRRRARVSKDVRRGLVLIVLLLAAMASLPYLSRMLTPSVAPGGTVAKPAAQASAGARPSAIPTSSRPAAGQACNVVAAKATGPQGHPLICSVSMPTLKLVWKRVK